MSERNIFEVATRTKMRFPYRGVISVEDLWDLSVQQLDNVFKTLNKELKQSEEDSLLGVKTKQNQELQDQISIIRHIVEVKQADAIKKLEAKDKAEKKQKLMSVLAKKQDEAYEGMSVEEIQKMLDEM